MDKRWRAKVEAERMIRLMHQIDRGDDPELKNSVTMECAMKLIQAIGDREFDEYDAVFEPAEIRLKTNRLTMPDVERSGS